MFNLGLMLDDLMKAIGVKVSAGNTEFTRVEGLRCLNRAYWDLLDKFPFREKELTTEFDTVAGTRGYSVPASFEGLRQLSIYNEDNQKWGVLHRNSLYESEQNRPADDTDADQSIPTSYFRESDQIHLLPVPDDVYTIKVSYWTTLDDLTDSAAVYPDMPRNWHEIVYYGGVYRACLILRDFKGAANYKNQLRDCLIEATPVEAKEESDSRTSGLEVLGRDYDFD